MFFSVDSNKFGQKLLEKMGWTKGKGLGANEDGMTEHIRVSHKNDSKGLCFHIFFCFPFLIFLGVRNGI